MGVNLKSKKALAVGVAAVTVISAGAAHAYWSAAGSGTGTGTTEASTDSVRVVQTTTLTAMYPGDAAQTLSGTFTNPNDGPVHVNSVAVSVASVTKDDVTATGCTSEDFTLALNPMTTGWDAAVDDSATWTGATIKFNNTGANQDACKGVTVNLGYAVG